MWIKGITRRWLFNVLGIVVLVLVVLIVSLSFAVQNYTYNGILQALNANSRELTNVFIDYKNKTSSDFTTFAYTYVENFTSKESMELMVINSDGRIVLTSTGFTPDQNQPMNDYYAALQDAEGYGSWKGKLSSGERVMAVTRVLRNNDGMVVGGVRYVVSLENADRQILAIGNFNGNRCFDYPVCLHFHLFCKIYFKSCVRLIVRQNSAKVILMPYTEKA
ncbi:MAG: cache domain-containing protein [Acutalibacteraceae bacterium]